MYHTYMSLCVHVQNMNFQQTSQPTEIFSHFTAFFIFIEAAVLLRNIERSYYYRVMWRKYIQFCFFLRDTETAQNTMNHQLQ